MQDPAAAAVPVDVRVRFAHASVQTVAGDCGADVIHIKGPSVDPETNPGRRPGTDADVLVRPQHVPALVAGLVEVGWVRWADFDEGSRFEHAASFHHQQFGMLDVHQNFPGLHNAPRENFEELWRRRRWVEIGGVDCAVPDRLSERLILLLHAARTSPSHGDVTNHWDRLDQDERDRLDRLAESLGATVGLALATGRAEAVAGHREVALWQEYGDGERLEEWLARWRAAPSARSRLALLVRAPRVNRFALAERLGRQPTRAEVRREWWHRTRLGLTSAGQRLSGTLRRGAR